MSDAEAQDQDEYQDYVSGDLEDEGGARLTDLLAEQTLIGLMLYQPDLVTGVRDLVSPREFFDRSLGRVYEGLLGADGFRPDNEKIIEWLGGPGIVIADRSGGQLVGYLMSLGIEADAGAASALANTIFEVSERRLTQEGQTNLAGLDAWQSKMGALFFAERDDTSLNEPEFLVEDLIPEEELVIIMGETQTGKSFLTSHLGFAISRGVEFFGRRILEPRPVIWCCYEGAAGARGRMRGYANYFDIRSELPFVALTHPFDLWEKPENVDALINEVDTLCKMRFASKRPGALIIDTHNAATSGASEIDSEVVSKIRDRYKTIARVLGCTVIIVGHTNALGKHRGNEQLTNNVPTILTVSYKTRLENREMIQIKDNDGRPVRSVTVKKQREGETGKTFDFVLHGVETGIKNKFGKVRSTCVVVEPNFTVEPEPEERKKSDTKGGYRLSDIDDLFFSVLWTQLHEAGSEAPPELGLPRGTRAVHRAIVSKAYRDNSIPQDGTKPVSENTVKSRWDRSSRRLRKDGLIGFKEPHFWWTGKPVLGKPATQSQRSFLDDMRDPGPPPASDYEFPE
ncbi:MAG: AAA family ATPase [Bradyrhizobium sp.]